MINIILNSDMLTEMLQDENVKYVRLPFKRYETVIAYEGGISKNIEDIIHFIEECDFDNDKRLISKFTNTPIGLESLSEGCKTTIYVYYRTKKINKNEIINITDCGPNAIEYILNNFNDSDLTLYLGHLEIPDDVKCTFKLNGKVMNNTSEIFE